MNAVDTPPDATELALENLASICRHVARRTPENDFVREALVDCVNVIEHEYFMRYLHAEETPPACEQDREIVASSRLVCQGLLFAHIVRLMASGSDATIT
jgi:hypothetical protein